MINKQESTIYRARRDHLFNILSDQNMAALVIPAALEPEESRFRQDQNFWYYTGINEPGAVLVITADNEQVLFVPPYEGRRNQWVASELLATPSTARTHMLDMVEYLGDPSPGYSFIPFYQEKTYEKLVDFLRQQMSISGNNVIFTPDGLKKYSPRYSHQFNQYVVDRLGLAPKDLKSCAIDIAHQRRVKDNGEISLISHAIHATSRGLAWGYDFLKKSHENGELVGELHLEAIVESMMRSAGGQGLAFPTIVAGGKNATTLHYIENQMILHPGDLVTVDVGASVGYYASDITRTYPVSGKFTDRQAEIYDTVLACQKYIEDLARPGLYLASAEHADKSLHHKALQFLKENGFPNAMPHGIGHFMGIDVHDVGDRSIPLQPGDVITIEPGIYLPDEGIGVRIEDDYLITPNGALCLSEEIPKEREDLEF